MKNNKLVVMNVVIGLLCMVSCVKDSNSKNNNLMSQNIPVTNIEIVYSTLYNHENPYDDYGLELLYQLSNMMDEVSKFDTQEEFMHHFDSICSCCLTNPYPSINIDVVSEHEDMFEMIMDSFWESHECNTLIYASKNAESTINNLPSNLCDLKQNMLILISEIKFVFGYADPVINSKVGDWEDYWSECMRLKAVALFRNGRFFDKLIFLVQAADISIQWAISCAIESSIVNNNQNQS